MHSIGQTMIRQKFAITNDRPYDLQAFWLNLTQVQSKRRRLSPRWFTRPQTVTHSGTNRGRRSGCNYVDQSQHVTSKPNRQPTMTVTETGSARRAATWRQKCKIEDRLVSQKTTGWIAIKAYDDDPCRGLVVGVYTVQRIRDLIACCYCGQTKNIAIAYDPDKWSGRFALRCNLMLLVSFLVDQMALDEHLSIGEIR